VNAPIEKVWEYFTMPEYIIKWNNASDDWHTPRAENDLRAGGRFVYRMEAKDGSFGFDFGGLYNIVDEHAYIEYTMEDGRKVQITFTADGNATKVVESFEAENMNAAELQKTGWQNILDNFKRYMESN
ncbi:MAG TPA: SRPBCC domain-containing protein, partial [Chitinophagaceae bacterium]|nr:SRPBCC domain-containing protein [Chitinophagaceae bacterium]